MTDCKACGEPHGVCKCGKHCDRCGKLSDINDGLENLCNGCAIQKLGQLKDKRYLKAEEHEAMKFLEKYIFPDGYDKNGRVNVNSYLGASGER